MVGTLVLCVLLVAAWGWLWYSEERANEEERKKKEDLR